MSPVIKMRRPGLYHLPKTAGRLVQRKMPGVNHLTE